MQAFLRTVLVILAAMALVAACAPAQPTISAEQIQAQVETSVALTVAAQDAQAAQAQSEATATLEPTLTEIPSLTPIFPTVTPFTFVPTAGGSGGDSPQPDYACTFAELKPRDGVFAPGDPFDIVYYIKNTGTKKWPSNKDLNFVSGTKFTTVTGVSLPPLKPGDATTVSFDANAPMQKGNYQMTWKVEGGLCFPFTAIHVGKPGQDP